MPENPFQTMISQISSQANIFINPSLSKSTRAYPILPEPTQAYPSLTASTKSLLTGTACISFKSLIYLYLFKEWRLSWYVGWANFSFEMCFEMDSTICASLYESKRVEASFWEECEFCKLTSSTTNENKSLLRSRNTIARSKKPPRFCWCQQTNGISWSDISCISGTDLFYCRCFG